MTVSAPVRLSLATLLAATLAACGGGGGGTAEAPATPAPTTPSAPSAEPSPSSVSNADTVGRARALSALSSLALDGVPELPGDAGALAAVSGRTFHVDSRSGNDSSDGLAAISDGGARGPWRTLARLMSANLAAGDSVQLACGSEWNETLRLPASGRAGQPLVVRAPAAGCSGSTRPAIDGSVALPAAAWSLQQGAVYKTAIAGPVLQLTSGASTVWTEAHHPNRGFKPADPTSLYLSAAADGSGTTIHTGTDLQLPAGATLGAGTRVRTRNYAWTMQELPLASFNGRQITLAQPMNYPLGASWGYFLLGQRWMVDSAGEWFHDATAGQLYAQMPDGGVPASLRATVLATGIDLRGLSHIVVDGIAVRRVGLGADLRGASNATLRNLRLEDLADRGVDATSTVNAVVEASAFTRTGAEAVSGWRHDFAPSNGLVVRNNVVRDSGVRMNGEEVQGLPRYSYAAIYGGTGSTISGNTVINTGYIGIQVMGASTVEKNFVFGACSVFDDGAGIYTQTSSGSTIRGNTVVHARGALAGKATTYTQAQGIYLDESISQALVEDNTVIDADNGIQVHDSAHIVVRNNRLLGNRRSQIWLQETRNRDNAAGDLFDVQVTGNQIAPVAGTSVGLWIDTIMPSSAHFGSIDGNRYFDRASPVAVRESRAAGWREFTLAQWRASSDATLPAGRDATGSATSDTGYAAFGVAGTNLVPNAGLLADSSGWTSWNQTAPLGQLIRETCPAGICLRYVAGGSPGLVSTPNFSVVKDQWYRMSVDLATEADAQTVKIVLRRGGGGSNGYESLSDRELSINAGRSWRRTSIVFQATATVNARDPVTGDLGARIDIDGIAAGRSVSLANLEIVPVTRDGVAGLTSTLVNVGNAGFSRDCPLGSAQAAGCNRLVRLADNQAVAWPMTVPAFGTVIALAQEPTLRDSDGDGIADAQDSCPGTPAGSEVDAKGCPLVLR